MPVKLKTLISDATSIAWLEGNINFGWFNLSKKKKKKNFGWFRLRQSPLDQARSFLMNIGVCKGECLTDYVA